MFNSSRQTRLVSKPIWWQKADETEMTDTKTLKVSGVWPIYFNCSHYFHYSSFSTNAHLVFQDMFHLTFLYLRVTSLYLLLFPSIFLFSFSPSLDLFLYFLAFSIPHSHSLSPSFNLSVWFLCPSYPNLCLLFVHIFRVCKQCEETASSVLTGLLHARGDRDMMMLWPVAQRTGTMLCRDITSRWTPSIFDAETRKLFLKAGAMSSRKSSWAARGPPSVSLSLEDKASLWTDRLTPASPGPYPLKSREKPL